MEFALVSAVDRGGLGLEKEADENNYLDSEWTVP